MVGVGGDDVIAAVEGGPDEDSIGWQAAKLTTKPMDKATFFQLSATPTKNIMFKKLYKELNDAGLEQHEC